MLIHMSVHHSDLMGEIMVNNSTGMSLACTTELGYNHIHALYRFLLALFLFEYMYQKAGEEPGKRARFLYPGNVFV